MEFNGWQALTQILLGFFGFLGLTATYNFILRYQAERNQHRLDNQFANTFTEAGTNIADIQIGPEGISRN